MLSNLLSFLETLKNISCIWKKNRQTFKWNIQTGFTGGWRPKVPLRRLFQARTGTWVEPLTLIASSHERFQSHSRDLNPAVRCKWFQLNDSKHSAKDVLYNVTAGNIAKTHKILTDNSLHIKFVLILFP